MPNKWILGKPFREWPEDLEVNLPRNTATVLLPPIDPKPIIPKNKSPTTSQVNEHKEDDPMIITPAENSDPISIFSDKHNEELCFPEI